MGSTVINQGGYDSITTTSDYTIKNCDRVNVRVDATLDNVNIELPDFASFILLASGFIRIEKIDSSANKVIIKPFQSVTSCTINGARNNIELSNQNESVLLVFDNLFPQTQKYNCSVVAIKSQVKIDDSFNTDDNNPIIAGDDCTVFASKTQSQINHLSDTKSDLITDPIDGNIVTVDANGQPIDSGKTWGNDGTNDTVATSAEMQSYVTQQLINAPSLPPVMFATTANDSLSGLAARDGYTPIAGNACLVKNQTNTANNGIWLAVSGAWSRAVYNTTTKIYEAVTTQTKYSELNITNGVVNVLNGTANKNLQFQIFITNPDALFGASTITITATTKIPASSPFVRYVDNSLGNDTNNNGSQSFPFLTIARCFIGASYPLWVNVNCSGSAYAFPTSLTNANVRFLGSGSVTSSQTALSGASITISANYQNFENLQFQLPVFFGAGFGHNFENCQSGAITSPLFTTLSTFANSYFKLQDVDMSSNQSIYTMDLSLGSGSIYLNSVNAVRVKFGTNSNIRLYLTDCPTATFDNASLGNIVYTDSGNIIVNSILTSQAQLNALLVDTNVATDGYYTTQGFTPSIGYVGDILLKQSVQSVITNIAVTRAYAKTTSITLLVSNIATTAIKSNGNWVFASPTPVANNIPLLDAQGNLNIKNIINGISIITNSNNNLILTEQSKRNYVFNGSDPNQSVQLPNSTSVSLGLQFSFQNRSTANIALKTSNNVNLLIIPPNSDLIVILSDKSNANSGWVTSTTTMNPVGDLPVYFYTADKILTNEAQIAVFQASNSTAITAELPDKTTIKGKVVVVQNSSTVSNSIVNLVGSTLSYALAINQMAICYSTGDSWAIQVGSSSNTLSNNLTANNLFIGDPLNKAIGGAVVGAISLLYNADNSNIESTINDNSVTSAKINDNAITSAKINDSAVTMQKIENIDSSILLGRVSADTGNVEELTTSQVQGLLGYQNFRNLTDLGDSNVQLTVSQNFIIGTITTLRSYTLPPIADFVNGSFIYIYNSLSSTAGAVLNITSQDFTFQINILPNQSCVIQVINTSTIKRFVIVEQPEKDLIGIAETGGIITTPLTVCNSLTAITLTLPNATTFTGQTRKIMNIGSGTVTVSFTNGSTQKNIQLAQYEALVLESSGNLWIVLSQPASSVQSMPSTIFSSQTNGTGNLGTAFIRNKQLYYQGHYNGTIFGRDSNIETSNAPYINKGIPVNAFVDVVYNSYGMLALTDDGRVFVWNSNALGTNKAGVLVNFGSNVLISRIYTNPIGVSTPSYVTYFAISTTGKLYAWGANNWGQCGVNSTTLVTTPTLIPALSNLTITSLSIAGYDGTHVGCIDSNNDLYMWGYGGGVSGMSPLGINTDGTNLLSPARITAFNGIASKVSCGGSWDGNFARNYTLVLTKSGTVWGTGRNDNGQLGIGTTTNTKVFTQCKFNDGNFVTGIADITATDTLYAGVSIITTISGFVFFSGRSWNGCIGTGVNSTLLSSFTAPPYSESFFQGKMSRTNATVTPKILLGGNCPSGNNYLIILDKNGTLYTVGYNGTGNLGCNDATEKQLWQIPSINNMGAIVEDFILSGRASDAGGYGIVAKLSNGSIVACGRNNWFMLSNGLVDGEIVDYFRYLTKFDLANKWGE